MCRTRLAAPLPPSSSTCLFPNEMATGEGGGRGGGGGGEDGKTRKRRRREVRSRLAWLDIATPPYPAETMCQKVLRSTQTKAAKQQGEGHCYGESSSIIQHGERPRGVAPLKSLERLFSMTQPPTSSMIIKHCERPSDIAPPKSFEELFR